MQPARIWGDRRTAGPPESREYVRFWLVFRVRRRAQHVGSTLDLEHLQLGRRLCGVWWTSKTVVPFARA